MSRRSLLAAGLLLWAVIFFGYAGPSWMLALYRLLTDGLLAGLWLLAATGLGLAALIPFTRGRRAMPLRYPLLHLLTAAALGIGILSLLILTLGLLGWLNRPVAILLMLPALLTLPTLRHIVDSQPAAGFPRYACLLWLIAAAFLAMTMIAALVPPGLLWPGDPHGYDVISYHFQIPREWHEAGRIIPLDHNVFSFFPFNVEMHFLLAMHLRGGPWAGMYLAHFMHLVMVLLSILAIYAICRALRPAASAIPLAILAAIAAAATPWMSKLASVGFNEGGLLLFGTLAIGWTLLALRAHFMPRMILAGLLTGLACGVKLTAGPLLLAGIPAALLFTIILRRRKGHLPRVLPHDERNEKGEMRKEIAVRPFSHLSSLTSHVASLRGSTAACLRAFPHSSLFILTALLLFSPWAIRNLAWTGNPLFPQAATLLGQAHFSDLQVQRWQAAHAPAPHQRALSARLAAGGREILLHPAYGYVLIPLGLAAAILSLLRARRPAVIFLLSLLALHVLFWLLFTHLQGRFFILAIPIAALLLGHLPRALPRTRIRQVPIAAALILLAFLPALRHLHILLTAPPDGRMSVIEFDRHVHTSTGIAGIIGREAGLTHLFTPIDGTPPGTGRGGQGVIILIADARAFLYQIPMDQLRYRTVFDVDTSSLPPNPTPDQIIAAWTAGRPVGPHEQAWIDPIEYRRLAADYLHIPPPPPQWQRPRHFTWP